MLAWKEVYITGFPEIDDQHKRLFQVINKLGTCISKSREKELLEETLNFLEEYIQTHFRFEEECMLKVKCPVALENKRAHNKFAAGYLAYRERYQRHGFSRIFIKELHEECENWLSEHICKLDIHLKNCTQRESIKPHE